MSDIAASEIDDRPVDRRSTRLALAGVGLGIAALIAATAMLWASEGVGVFANVILAGLSACL